MTYGIILAAGQGERLGPSPKQFLPINDKPLWRYSAEIFASHPQIDEVLIVVPTGYKIDDFKFVEGGKTRQKSAEKAIAHLSPNPDDLLVFHNAANPFVTVEEISNVISFAKKTGAAYVAHPVTSTLHAKSGTLNRNDLYAAETPQAVRTDLYLKALEQDLEGTDEMMLAEQLGVKPIVVLASENNFKITTPRDLEFAKFLLEGEVVTGIGQDSHRFHETEKGLTLGGLLLPNEPKMVANSDGDVILHALCNAICGALGQGSFSSIADPLCEQGITDSREYLKAVLGDNQVTQISLQLEGSRPKIDPIEKDLKKSIAALLFLHESKIGLTATTGEDLTPFGRGEGLQCFATVTLKK